jgi:ubiquinone/menaquinone biosynthesis C-methylase UbiE
MRNFKTRATDSEMMDNPLVPAKDVHKALRELEIINKYLGGYSVIIDALEKSGVKNGTGIMDIGCGGGDMLRAVSNHFKRKNIYPLRLYGVDINPYVVSYAEEKTSAYSDITYLNLDINDNQVLKSKPEIIINSLFCHHFNDEDLISLVKRFYALAGETVIINDLHRHPVAYYSIKGITKIFSDSYLVKYDAPLSVARSLKKREWEFILSEAGVTNFQINWKWAWRWQIIIKK